MSGQISASVSGSLFVVIGAALWSTGGVGVKILEGYSALTISSGRGFAGAVMFLVLMRGKLVPPPSIRVPTALASIFYAAVVTTFVIATKYTTAANAILLQHTAPLWVAVVGAVVLRERPTRRELVAMAIGGAGVFMCMYEGLSWMGSGRGVTSTLLGDGVGLLSGVSFGMVTILIRKMNSAEPYIARQSTAALWCLFYGNVLTGLVGLPVLAEEIGSQGIPDWPLTAGWLLVVWLGVGQLGLGYWFFQHGLTRTPALTASLLALTEPVLNPLWVGAIVGETPSTGTMWGGVAVLSAVVILVTGMRRRAKLG